MKSIKLAAVCSLLIGSAGATTISVGGGTSSSLFVTNTGVALTSANASFAMGTWNGTTFNQFASIDATPMVLGTTAPFVGRLTGNFSDNTDAATAFNGQLIWLRVIVTTPQGNGTAYFTGADTGANFPAISTKFPNNGFGSADSLAFETRNLTVASPGSTEGSLGYNGTNITVGIIPEPSVALLGALGVLGFLRRRR